MGKADQYLIIYDLKAQNCLGYFSSYLFFYSYFSWTQTLRGENPSGGLTKARYTLDKTNHEFATGSHTKTTICTLHTSCTVICIFFLNP